MRESKTLKDLVEIYRTAKQAGDNYTTQVAENSISSFVAAESALVTMSLHEAAAASAVGLKKP